MENPEGMYLLIIECIQSVLQKQRKPNPKKIETFHVMEYELDDEDIPEFQKDLLYFDSDKMLGDDLRLYDEEGYTYFDYNEDVISIPDLLRSCAFIKDKKISYDIRKIFFMLYHETKYYRERLLKGEISKYSTNPKQ